jgi:hypothetical protein
MSNINGFEEEADESSNSNVSVDAGAEEDTSSIFTAYEILETIDELKIESDPIDHPNDLMNEDEIMEFFKFNKDVKSCRSDSWGEDLDPIADINGM